MAKDSQGSSHHLKVVGGAYGKRKDLIYESHKNPFVSTDFHITHAQIPHSKSQSMTFTTFMPS